MININPSALLNVGIGSLGIMYAINKKPPEWLILGSFLISVLSVTRASQDLFAPEVEGIIIEPAPFFGLMGLKTDDYPGCECRKPRLL